MTALVIMSRFIHQSVQGVHPFVYLPACPSVQPPYISFFLAHTNFQILSLLSRFHSYLQGPKIVDLFISLLKWNDLICKGS